MKAVGLVVHHSLTKDGKTEDWAGIKAYHTSFRCNGETVSKAEFVRLQAIGAKGLESPWADIGYHVGVERVNGVLTTLTGRPLDATGAHCVGHNNMIGLCIVGNFDSAPPDVDLLQYAAEAAAAYLRLCNLTIDTMHRHSEYAPKTCPGAAFPWYAFRSLVEHYLTA